MQLDQHSLACHTALQEHLNHSVGPLVLSYAVVVEPLSADRTAGLRAAD